jgi:hypothetical protein
MFGDGGWDSSRSAAQERLLVKWLNGLQGKLAVVEMGAGLAIPTVRSYSEHAVDCFDATLIRINVRESAAPPGQIPLPLGALEALQRIDALLPG